MRHHIITDRLTPTAVARIGVALPIIMVWGWATTTIRLAKDSDSGVRVLESESVTNS